jgi:hypothetical protein
MDMTAGTWSVRSLYRGDSLVPESKELSAFKLDLVGVREVRWVGASTELAGFLEKGILS